jgi:hypothetical protein
MSRWWRRPLPQLKADSPQNSNNPVAENPDALDLKLDHVPLGKPPVVAVLEDAATAHRA